eukprot:TRINITY_DN3189_c0_g3_i2.p1 TRINITY_DN3189_c0_g3~~TRINITY_DN3189_c0_g3_i2.p1  ORF type:complete len:277 (-),score=55.99 TRINITY_DN3189_c0_g3_i2:69-899(-)
MLLDGYTGMLHASMNRWLQNQNAKTAAHRIEENEARIELLRADLLNVHCVRVLGTIAAEALRIMCCATMSHRDIVHLHCLMDCVHASSVQATDTRNEVIERNLACLFADFGVLHDRSGDDMAAKMRHASPAPIIVRHIQRLEMRILWSAVMPEFREARSRWMNDPKSPAKYLLELANFTLRTSVECKDEQLKEFCGRLEHHDAIQSLDVAKAGGAEYFESLVETAQLLERYIGWLLPTALFSASLGADLATTTKFAADFEPHSIRLHTSTLGIIDA